MRCNEWMVNSMAWVHRYLSYLQIPLREPSLVYLKQLLKAHRHVFPFENVSKLHWDKYAKNRLIRVEDFLNRFESFQTGGTCFTLNIQFARLLKAIGFRVQYILPGGDHLALLVTLNEEKNLWYVDAGTPTPMLAPVSLTNGEKQTPIFAGERVIVKKTSGNGRYEYVRSIGGRQVSKPLPFQINVRNTLDDLIDPIKASFQTDAPYMTQLRIDKWCNHRQIMISLKNDRLTLRNRNGGKTERQIKSLADLQEVMQNVFYLPKLPVNRAVETLQHLQIR